MQSGAGRILTRRSTAAFAARCAAPCASNRCTHARTSRSVRASPHPGNSPAMASSIRARSAGDRCAVSRAITVHRHSLVCPRPNTASTRGISRTNAAANPTCRLPLCELSRRANPTCPVIDRPASPDVHPALSSRARCETANASVNRACAAAATALSPSSSPTSAIRSSSDTDSIAASIATIAATCSWFDIRSILVDEQALVQTISAGQTRFSNA